MIILILIFICLFLIKYPRMHRILVQFSVGQLSWYFRPYRILFSFCTLAAQKCEKINCKLNETQRDFVFLLSNYVFSWNESFFIQKITMFSVPPKFVCTVCHVRVKSKEILEKHMERHNNVTFKLKGKSYKIFSDIYAINIL